MKTPRGCNNPDLCRWGLKLPTSETTNFLQLDCASRVSSSGTGTGFRLWGMGPSSRQIWPLDKLLEERETVADYQHGYRYAEIRTSSSSRTFINRTSHHRQLSKVATFFIDVPLPNYLSKLEKALHPAFKVRGAAPPLHPESAVTSFIIRRPDPVTLQFTI